MLRSAAKNHRDVAVVCDPSDYDRVLASLENPDDAHALRRELAQKVFARTASYDLAISEYLAKQNADTPDLDEISGSPQNESSDHQGDELEVWGEPHQQAALYGEFLDYFDQLQGKELPTTTSSISRPLPI